MRTEQTAFLCTLLVFFTTYALGNIIDVVIPCHPKDVTTLELAIQGIRRNGADIRRVIVISSEKITSNAEWIDESIFPFSKKDISLAIFNDENKAHDYLKKTNNRIGWIYQQLLKLYAPLVIPDISSDVLILDSDTIFLNPTSFIDKQGYALFNVGTQYCEEYFAHMNRLLPGLKREYAQYSGITHHALFQKHIIEDLFKKIQKQHNKEPWQALCSCIDSNKELFANISEYEIYFNFAITQGYKIKIRPLRWADIKFDTNNIHWHKKNGYHYVSCHTYLN